MTTSIKIDDQPRMEKNEIELFSYALGISHHFLEYGCGASTKFALSFGTNYILSVDSDQEWIEALSGDVRIKANIEKRKLSLLHVNIGKTHDWGFPIETKMKESWINYSRFPWLKLKHLGITPDLVLVDGRFRVACALRAIIHYLENGHMNPLSILLHDVVEDRPTYRIPFEFCNVVARAGSLFLLQPKNNIEKQTIVELYSKYAFDPE